MQIYCRILIALLSVNLLSGCGHLSRNNRPSEPLPIIRLVVTEGGHKGEVSYYLLHAPYGLIMSNSWANDGLPDFYLFCRDEKRIVHERTIEPFLDELKRIRKGSEVHGIRKCTVGWTTQFGVDISREWKLVEQVIQERECTLDTESQFQEMLCYCTHSLTFLHEYIPLDKLGDAKIYNPTPVVPVESNEDVQSDPSE